MTIRPTEHVAAQGLLDGKVIIITGASQGIGQAAAFGFALAGATVVLAARRSEVIDGHVAAIASRGGSALAVAADVTNDGDIRQLVDRTMATFGRLDGAFNNAGAEQTPAQLVDTSWEEWKEVHDVKIHGTFLCMRHEIPAMIASGGGSIVNQGSVVATRTVSVYPAPASSQAAIHGLTLNAAAAYARDGVRVNYLVTGLIITPEREPALADPNVAASLNAFAPIGRPGTAVENAAAAAWLLSDYSSYVTGIGLPVDGGHLAGVVR